MSPSDPRPFEEPWQAQAFAMTVSLHAAGCFTWAEWAASLSRELHRPGGGATPYYHHWLAALERLCAEAGVLDPAALAARREAWRDAAAATPHGEPVLLPPA